jgi:CBS domain containing-hemolysin-like protein
VLLLCLIILIINTWGKTGLKQISKEWLDKLESEQNPRVATIRKLLANLPHLDNCIHTANIVCYVIAPAVAISAIHQFNVYDLWVSVMIFTLVFAVLLFTRAIPHGMALRHPEKYALRYQGFLKGEVGLFSPITKLVNRSALLTLRQGQSKEQQEQLEQKFEQPDPPVIVALEEDSFFEYGERPVREVMIPRLDIIAASLSSTPEELAELVLKNWHSRLPIYRETIDQIVGILYARDLLRYLQSDDKSEMSLMSLLRTPYFVPENKRVDELFTELQSHRARLAIVVDEYGGTAGLVTTEDLLAEIVGEINDEYDRKRPEYVRLNPDEVIVDARMNLNEVNNFFNTRWSSESVDTIGGYVYDKLGKIPRAGEELILDRMGQPRPSGEDLQQGDVAIVVMAVTGQRLRRLRLLNYSTPKPYNTTEDDSNPSERKGVQGNPPPGS